MIVPAGMVTGHRICAIDPIDRTDLGRPVIALAELLAGAQAIVVFLEMFPDEIGFQTFDRLEAEVTRVDHRSRPSICLPVVSSNV